MNDNSTFNQNYWEKNIEGFAGFYDKQSEEHIPGPKLLSTFYKRAIFPLEKKYMYDRHTAVSQYIDAEVKDGMKVADIGCGSGVYTKHMIQKGAFVYALDYAKSAVDLTLRNLTDAEKAKAEVRQFDVTKEAMPQVDLAISIGVLPYIEDLETYLGNMLPKTNQLLFNFLEASHPLNALRRSVLSFLDVRKYSYHSFETVESILTNNGFRVVRKIKLATGLIIETERV